MKNQLAIENDALLSGMNFKPLKNQSELVREKEIVKNMIQKLKLLNQCQLTQYQAG